MSPHLQLRIGFKTLSLTQQQQLTVVLHYIRTKQEVTNQIIKYTNEHVHTLHLLSKT